MSSAGRGRRSTTEGLPDDELAAAAKAGDRDALESLLRRHHDRLYALARRLVGNPDDALDATQDALLAISRGLHRFDGRSSFGTWAYRVATNACFDELRRRRRRPEPTEEEATGVSAPTADVVAEGAARRLDVDAALATLPDEFRAPVVLRDLCGLDYAEIAEVLELRPGTVRSRIARGRAALAAQLGEDEGNHSPTGERRRRQG